MGLGGIGSLLHQIEFGSDGVIVIRDHLTRAQAMTIRDEALDQPGAQIHQPQIAPDLARHARTQHLDHHFATISEPGRMHLGDRRRTERLLIEVGEHALQRKTISSLDDASRLRTREGRHSILQLASSSAISKGSKSRRVAIA